MIPQSIKLIPKNEADHVTAVTGIFGSEISIPLDTLCIVKYIYFASQSKSS